MKTIKIKNTNLLFGAVIIASTFFTGCKKDEMGPNSSVEGNKIFFYTYNKIKSTDHYQLYVNEALVGELQTVEVDPNNSTPDCQSKNMLYIHSPGIECEHLHIKVLWKPASDAHIDSVFVDGVMGIGSGGADMAVVDNELKKGDMYSIYDAWQSCKNGAACNFIILEWK